MKDLAIKKLYHSISEVSEMTSVKPYILRYWESEFPQLKPSKNRAGKRIYRQNDIRLIRRIKMLLYEEKFTIEGAINRINESNKNKEQFNLPLNSEKLKSAVVDLKKELQDILDLLDDKNN